MSHEQTVRAVGDAIRDRFASLDAWFDRPETLLRAEPGSGWTAGQILEHVALTNHYLMLTLTKWVAIAERRAARGVAIPTGESNLGRLEIIGRRGSFAWDRPDHMEPSARPNLAETRAILRRQQAECLALLDRMGGGLGGLASIRMTVADLGRIDLYQWLHFLAQHARRHLEQLAALETLIAAKAVRDCDQD